MTCKVRTDARCALTAAAILLNLLSLDAAARYTAKAFQTLPYFNSMLVSVLKFMERDNFAARTREEKCQFLRGLLKLLPQFSQALLRRKILTSLVELMHDRTLLPYILPNVFFIAKNLSSIEFTTKVLPRVRHLFVVQDPPQTLMLLLNNIDLFIAKTSPAVFREEVTPMLYAAFESEHIAIQENALRRVPRICELLEYSHVKEKLFPTLTALFGKTKTLSVKVGALICFHAMVPVLDKHTLTDNLAPALSRIKTREPSVVVAALAVYEALALKVDRETLALSVLPQLWIMSMGTGLNAMQYQRFMRAIHEIGKRVETEHLAHLQEQKTLHSHTEEVSQGSRSSTPHALGAGIAASGEIDFAALVGHAKREDAAHGLHTLLTGAETPAPSKARMDSLLFDPLDDDNSSAIAQAGTPPVKPTLSRPLAPPPRQASVPSPAQRAAPPAAAGLFDGLMRADTRPPVTPDVSTPPLPQQSAPAPQLSIPTQMPPGWSGGVLQPTSQPKSAGGRTANTDWSDFDPLK